MDTNVLISPQGLPGASGIVGDLAWNQGSALLLPFENLGGFAISKPFTADASASYIFCQVAPAATAVFQIYLWDPVNDPHPVPGQLPGTLIGTATIDAGDYVGIVAFLPGLNVIPAGVVVGVMAPVVPDGAMLLMSMGVASL